MSTALAKLIPPNALLPPSRIDEHKKQAFVMLTAFPESDKVYEHHMLAARMELEDFGIADPMTFDAKLQKAG